MLQCCDKVLVVLYELTKYDMSDHCIRKKYDKQCEQEIAQIRTRTCHCSLQMNQCLAQRNIFENLTK